VVAVAEGGVRETVIDGVTGLQVPHDARAMAAAITRLRDDPALARLLGEAACVEVKTRWSSDAATQRIVHELELFAHAA
jgi:glycosyltransferase involved in cell wall biosynthesis